MKEPLSKFKVTAKAQRPANINGKCFYCYQEINDYHKKDCVLIKKKATVKFTIEYEVNVPSNWEKENVNFHRNESSWCADNTLAELKEITEKEGCLCSASTFTCLNVKDEFFLEE